MPRSTNKPIVNNQSVSKPVVHNSAIQNGLPFTERPSLFSSIKQGFGFGVGSSIAHNIFDSKPSQPKIIDKTAEFKQCMEKTYNNYEECAPILK